MDDSKKFLEEYLHHRFFEVYDANGKDLCLEFLQQHKNSVAEKDYTFAHLIDVKTRNLTELCSRDDNEATDAELAKITEYRNFADNEKIPNLYKIEMLDLAINCAEKYDFNPDDIYDMIIKKLQLVKPKDSRQLQLISLQRSEYKNKVSPQKLKKSETLWQEKNNPAPAKSKKAQSKEENLQEFQKIAQKLSGEKLSDDERLALLEAQYKLCNQCGFTRSANFSHRIKIANELKILYFNRMDEVNYEHYTEEVKRYTSSLSNCRKYFNQSRQK